MVLQLYNVAASDLGNYQLILTATNQPSITSLSVALGQVPSPNPAPAIVASSTGAGTFGFTISGAINQTVIVEACTNLSQPVWVPIQTNQLTTGTATFADPQAAQNPARFYRVR